MSKRNLQEGNEPDRKGATPGDPFSTAPASRMPAVVRRLKKGDRVSFETGEGVDGPPYAMNVRFVDDD